MSVVRSWKFDFKYLLRHFLVDKGIKMNRYREQLRVTIPDHKTEILPEGLDIYQEFFLIEKFSIIILDLGQ